MPPPPAKQSELKESLTASSVAKTSVGAVAGGTKEATTGVPGASGKSVATADPPAAMQVKPASPLVTTATKVELLGPTTVLCCRDVPSSIHKPVTVGRWEAAAVLRRTKDQWTLAMVSDDAELSVSEQEVVPFEFPDALSTLNDLSLLPNASTSAVLYATYQRFRANCHYTFGGPMLIAVNPYQWLTYARSAPHPRKVAEAAYAALQNPAEDGAPLPVTVLITGLSGAGKTEAAKMVVRTIVHDCLKNVDATTMRTLDAVDPILELFGNAPTTMNDNSSRFVKRLTLHVDTQAKSIASVKIESFLLEVSRIVHVNQGEGTFHVFPLLFQSSNGIRLELKKELDLWDPSQFRCLRPVGATAYHDPPRPPYSLDALLEALGRCGFDATAIENLLRLLAGILHLLNIDFVADDAYAPARIVDKKHIEIAARLLGLVEPPPQHQTPKEAGGPVTFLERVLTSVQLGNDTKFLHKSAASATRDSLAKTLYEALFQLLLRKCTSTIPAEGKPFRTFQLLDIFGFEQVQPPARNDLEQLLINYTNEVLQGLYDETTVTAFRNDVEREGVQGALLEVEGESSWASSTIENKCLDVLTKRPNGILNVISDDSTLAQQSSSQATQLADKILALQRVFPEALKRNKVNPTAFQLAHYCDVVEYSTETMGHKNRISSGVAYVMRNSGNPIVRDAHAVVGSLLKTTASQISLFREQLDRLHSDLRQSSLFWIRCIKPNTNKSPVEFDGGFVSAQLSASGVYRTMQLQAEGYAVRMPHQSFAVQFLVPYFSGKLTTKPAAEQFFALMGQSKFQAACTWAAKTVPACQNRKLLVGITKVFTKSKHLAELAEQAKQWKLQALLLIGRTGRGQLGRLLVAALRLKRLKALRLEVVKQRIQEELPVRQQLERERVALHNSSAGVWREECNAFTALMQKRTQKFFRHAVQHMQTVSDELRRATEDLHLYDVQRRRAEGEERERYLRIASSAQAAEAEIEKDRAKRREQAALRAQSAQKERARAAERERLRLMTAEEERRVRENHVAAQRLQHRAEEAVRLRQLQASQASYEEQMVKEARRHLERCHQRSSATSGLSSLPLRDGDRRALTHGRSHTSATADRTFAMQRDMWKLWEESSAAA